MIAVPKDTAELLLRELALHLSYGAEVNGSKSAGRPVGCLSLSKHEGDLWKRIIDVLGGEPDMIRDVVGPAIVERLTMQPLVCSRRYLLL